MRININFKLLVSLVGFLLIVSLLKGQTYSFRTFGTDKIPNGFVYTLNQSNDGFLWVGTASGLTRFDGYDFFPVQYPDSSCETK
jgi:ligand-binding sensor domain-containing protein